MSKNSIGIGHAHPRAVEATNAAGMVDHANVNLALGKPPLPKKAFTSAPEIHSGMNAKSRRDGTHFAGLSGQDLSRYDANGPDPLSGAPQGKRLTPVMASPGMKDQSATAFADEISRAAAAKKILDEAADNSAPDDRRALGIGTLPGLVEEK
jgi:hypothetical protein